MKVHIASRRLLALFVVLVALAALGMGLSAARRPRASLHASPEERQFIGFVRGHLMSEYSTTAKALRAHYVAITGIEDDGTAVYFNPSLRLVDALHPNFLWYDRRRQLVGLDYEFPVSAYPQPPTALFPVSVARWTTVKEHVHFNYRIGDEPIRMGTSDPRPNLHENPITLAELRADKLLPNDAKLVWAYDHPKSWDLGFWLVPNPNGAFAARNPRVQR